MPASTACIITCLLCGPSSGGRTPFALNRSHFIKRGSFSTCHFHTWILLPLGLSKSRAADRRRMPCRMAMGMRSFPVPRLGRRGFLLDTSRQHNGSMLLRPQSEAALGSACRARARDRPCLLACLGSSRSRAPRASQSSRTRRYMYACSTRCSCQVKSSQVKSSLYVNNRNQTFSQSLYVYCR